MLSEYRKRKFTHLFKILDFDHNGYIQRSDFAGLGQNISTFNCIDSGSPEDILIIKRSENLWNHLLVYFDGGIHQCNLDQWIEFLSWISSKQSPISFNRATHQLVQDIFSLYDLNKDLLISRREFMCFFVSLRVDVKQTNECFDSLDLNNDGMISRTELFIAIKEYFQSEDPTAPGNQLFGNIDSFKFETRTHRVFG